MKGNSTPKIKGKHKVCTLIITEREKMKKLSNYALFVMYGYMFVRMFLFVVGVDL